MRLAIKVFLFALCVWLSGLRAAHAADVDEAEIQQDVQRIASSASNLLIQAVLEAGAKSPPRVADELKRRLLSDGSALLELSTGPSPVNNLLDLAVFFRLSRQTLEEFWVPRVLGRPGLLLVNAYADGERQTSAVLDKIAKPEQKTKLYALTDDWRKRHPRQVRVEGVRFTEFSSFARGSHGSSQEARGLLGSIRSATATADRALLLAERTLFIAQRMPSLLRLQALVGTTEIASELRSELTRSTKLMGEIRHLDPFMNDLSSLVVQSRLLAVESQKLATAVRSIVHPRSPPGELRKVLANADKLTNSARGLVEDLNQAGVPEKLERSIAHVDGLARKWALYLIAIGFGWAAFGWGGYYLAKRALRARPA